MQQKKLLRVKRDSRPITGNSNIGQRLSIIGANKSQDTRSKLRSSRDSDFKEFKKTKIKLNTLSSIGSLGIEEQIKKQMGQANDLLKECEKRIKQRVRVKTQKEELIQLEDLIKYKDQMIKGLAVEIDSLKKSDKNIPEEQSHSSTHKNTTDSSQKQKMFKLAEEMRNQREELAKCMSDHVEKYANYMKIKKMIEEIELKYTKINYNKESKDQYNGPPMMTYEQFKEKAKNKKEQPSNKVKKIDFYHHLSPEKQANPSKNMKDLISRKNITLAALKNSRKKHSVEMNELFAKIQFLKDEDILLTQKIRQKQQELASMQKKFSERKGQHQRIQRNTLMNFS